MGIQFTVYRTTNLVNSRYYIGVHKTSQPNDGYLGSGKLLKRAIAKYGVGNFRKEVLFVFETDAEAFAKEFELVEAAKADPLCYNLRRGGSGGFDWINRNGLSGALKGVLAINAGIKNDPIKSIARIKQARVNALHFSKSERGRNHSRLQAVHSRSKWTGQRHTNEWKRAQSKRMTGRNNPNFGKKRIKTADGKWLWVA